jgi:hypothetical protein
MESADDVEMKSLTGLQDDIWRSLCSECQLSTPFHTLAWRDAVTDAFSYDPKYCVWYVDDQPVASLPVFEVGGLIYKTLVNPFCEYGFPLTFNNVSLARVADAVVTDQNWQTTILLKESDWTGTVGYNAAGFGAVQTGTARRLDVSADPDGIREHVFDQRLRANLRTAEECGVTVSRRASPSAVEAFYGLHLKTMRRKGSPQFPRAFFDALLSAFGDDAVLYLAEQNGKPISGLLAFDHDGSRHLWANASNRDHWEARPNDAVYARAVLDAAEQSATDIVDFGRSSPDSGVDRFKRRFGGESYLLTTLVTPPGRSSTGDVSGLRRLAPIAQRLTPVLTHPVVGPRLKERIHE